ncbi:MAG: Na+/H+ antiporter subunit E [Methanophagales archaeon]|nr:Na+/H+ antiporter subunit E [Methanophagales archaeon]
MKFKNSAGIFLTFAVLFGFWVVLSGHLDVIKLSMGIICSILVALYSHDLLFKDTGSKGRIGRTRIFLRFIAYIFWLLIQIFIANIDVARRVLDPRMPISPEIIKFKSELKSDLALTTLATSITLTPGTLTIDIIDGYFYIHCLSIESGEQLLKGDFERHMEHVFGEEVR